MSYSMLESVTVFAFNVDKDCWLREQRGIGFEDIIEWIDEGKAVEVAPHPDSARYPNQHIIRLLVNEYVVLVAGVFEEEICFLKTAYFSRKATRNHHKTKKGKDNVRDKNK